MAVHTYGDNTTLKSALAVCFTTDTLYFFIIITTFVQVVIATDNVNKINNTYMKNIPHCNTSVRSFLDWSKIEDADERESAIGPITPCIQQDTGRSQYNDSIITINILHLTAAYKFTGHGGYISVQKLNAMNDGHGFPIGYKTSGIKKYAHIRYVLLQVGNHRSRSYYREQHLCFELHVE